MDNYFVLRWFDKISEEEVLLTAVLYKNKKDNMLSERHISIPFDKNRMICISDDIKLDMNDDDSAILYFELIDGGDLIYGRQF